MRILLVEDNVVNQLVATRLLEKQGHKVVLASNGCEALAALNLHAFDLVLMDIQMPKMDGLETTAHIRAQERLTKTHLPIIAVTANVTKNDRERCLAAGMDGYVTKPFRAAALLEVITEAMRLSNLHAQSLALPQDAETPSYVLPHAPLISLPLAL